MTGCQICGGTHGLVGRAAHYLCEFRQSCGRPTPSMGNTCPCCQGKGNHRQAEDLRPRSYEPACTTCGGSGAVEVMDGKIREGHEAMKRIRRAWAHGCLK